jgi:hypothetical protein
MMAGYGYPYQYPYAPYPWYMPGGYVPGAPLPAGYVPYPFLLPPIKWEAPKDLDKPKYITINVIWGGFTIPEDKRRFTLKNNHFCVSQTQVDIANTTGNQLIQSLGGGEGCSLLEVCEHGGEEWTLGHEAIKFDSAAAKKVCKEYGWSRASDSGKRHNTIWVALKK